MSISTIQYKRKKDEFTRILVEKGIEPNNFELNRMMSEYFDNHPLGMPYYLPIRQKPYEESSKDDYNHNFETFREDIETIYQANIEANNKAVAMQQYYDLEKNKVRNALARLQLRVENIQEAMNSTVRVKEYVQVFDDLYDVEFYGDKKRNIPYTTSFIDLLQKKVYTETAHSQRNRLNMDNATVTIKGMNAFDQCYTKGIKENIIKDTMSEIFLIYGMTTNTKEKSIEIIIDLGSMMTFNSVSLMHSSTKVMHCSLKLSDDNENFVNVYDIDNREYAEWRFNQKTARYIKVICRKDEPDGLGTTEKNIQLNEYYFLLKNISIALEEFEQKSVFVSKLIDFDDLTSVIRLDANEMIFNHTRIDYFIGFDNESGRIGWDAIKNHTDHDLFMFMKHHKIVNAHVKNDYGMQGVDTHLYKLFELPGTVNRNSVKVVPGYNMWDVKRYNRYKGDSNEDGFSLVSGDFSDFIAKCSRKQLFMDCENYEFEIQTNVLYILTQYVQLDKQMSLYDKFVRVAAPGLATVYSSAEIRIFLNGYEVTTSEKSTYSFSLKKGVNKIQMAVYVPSKNAESVMLWHNLNFKQLTNDVFGFVPMKYTTNRILDKLIGDTYEYYTIKDNYVYVKCDPEDMIRSDIEDMGYFITYNAIREDMKDYFKGNHIKFRIMAVLNSSDPNVSPELVNFRITGK